MPDPRGTSVASGPTFALFHLYRQSAHRIKTRADSLIFRSVHPIHFILSKLPPKDHTFRTKAVLKSIRRFKKSPPPLISKPAVFDFKARRLFFKARRLFFRARRLFFQSPQQPFATGGTAIKTYSFALPELFVQIGRRHSQCNGFLKVCFSRRFLFPRQINASSQQISIHK